MRAAKYLAAATFAMAGFPAAAQVVDTASQRLELAGDAPPACALDAPSVTGAVNARFSASSTSTGQIAITELVDPQTANSRAASINLSFPAVCNASHRVSVRSGNGGLLRAGGNPANRAGGGNFGEFLTYAVGLEWAGATLSRDSDAGTLQVDAGRPATGEIVVKVNTPGDGGPLIAGQYSDSIVVEVQTAN